MRECSFRIRCRPRDLIYVNDISSDSELALILDGQNKDYAVKNDNYNGFKVRYRLFSVFRIHMIILTFLLMGPVHHQILVHASQKFPDVDGRGFLIAPGFTT